MSKVAFLGLGAMGSRTAANLQSRARADGLEPDSGSGQQASCVRCKGGDYS